MSPKAELLDTIAARYTPGTAVTPEVDDAVKTTAQVLEAEAGPPDLHATPALVSGMWQLLFDSRDLLHASSDMDRMSGGMLPAQTVAIHNTFQELRPGKDGAPGMYRNTMNMRAAGVDFSYISTASFTIALEAANMFQVSFSTTSFVPFKAGEAAALRQALKMPAHMPLDFVQDPPIGPFPSIVSYCDDDLRINRGESYIAVLERLA